jgi:hypothetical protein
MEKTPFRGIQRRIIQLWNETASHGIGGKMKTWTFVLSIVAFAILTACSLSPNNGADQTEENSMVATAVAATQAAEVETAQAEGDDIPEPAEIPEQATCEEMNVFFNQYLGIQGEIEASSFSDAEIGLDGEGCRLYASARGDQIDRWWDRSTALIDGITAAGWERDSNFSGAGAAGQMVIVRKSGTACMLISEAGPEDPSLCSGNESIVACLERLDPDNVLLEAYVGCTPDRYVPSEQDADAGNTDEAVDIRINFDIGKISAFVSGKLEYSTSQRYVLWAMKDQEMTVSVTTAPPGGAIVVIYGADGTVLISDHATTAFWTGTLPSTQDYYVRVVGSPARAVSYYMQVIIPPVGESYIEAYQPMPSTDCGALADLIGATTGVGASTSIGLFTDHVTSTAGIGCVITSWGRFNQFADRNNLSTTLENALTDDGWIRDEQYGGGGPGGFITGYTKGETLCLYTQLVHEIDPWVCDGVPGAIYECWNELEDSEMYFEVELNCAVEK